MSEMKNRLDGINGIQTLEKKKISEHEDRAIKII